MRRLLLAAATGAALTAYAGCIDNTNPVGTFEQSGSGGAVLVLGGRSGEAGSGGSGNAPGSTGGQVSGGPPLLLHCTVSGAVLSLPRACATQEDCVAVAETDTVRVSSVEPVSGCDVLYFGIAAAEASDLEAFQLACRAVAACPPQQIRVVTQDGKSGPLLGSTPLLTCRAGACETYLP